ncbi:guanine nucleotide binding protein, alpha subunit [Entophlyctis helioformis]|nr:guanine nucleotide binding protein, alpha subunit [Entophlyctis helioformis]
MSQPEDSINAEHQRAKSREIDLQISKEKEERERISKEPHILVLGSGDSGKTTFMKQLKILYGGGYGNDERQQYRTQIIENIPRLNAISSVEEFWRKYEEAKARQPLPLSPEIGDKIVDVWNDPDLKDVYSRATKAQLQDTAYYFLENAKKFADPSYNPTDADILHLRISTTAITETIFRIGKISYHFFDVGGQQKYRKRWTPYFDNVHNILFFISLASYDQMLVEDPTINRMHDALDLFGKICNHPLLKHIPMMLFMNKKDLFEKKVQSSEIKRFFPDFAKKNTYEHAVRFFESKFTAQNEQPQKEIFVHVTCATDTNSMKIVILKCIETLTIRAVQSSGIM